MTPISTEPGARNAGWRLPAAGVALSLVVGFVVAAVVLSFREELRAQESPGNDAGAPPTATLNEAVSNPNPAPSTEETVPDSVVEKKADNVLEESMGSEMSNLFPIGRPFSGVRIPSYTGDSLNSVVTAEKMRRVDEEHLDMEKLVIVSYSDGEEPDTRILMDRATYDMSSDKLISRSPVRIIQPRFEMTGDKMVFDSRTQVGHMTSNPGGRVRMLIFGVDQNFSGGMLGEPETD